MVMRYFTVAITSYSLPLSRPFFPLPSFSL